MGFVNRGDRCASSDGKARYYYGRLAQLGEHLPYKQGVGGSNPSSSTILISGARQRGRVGTDCKSVAYAE